MAIRIPTFASVPTRVSSETSFAPRPEVAPAPSRDSLFSDGFSNRAASPVSLGSPEPIALPALDLPAFKPGSVREIMARNYPTQVAEAPEVAEAAEPAEAEAERENPILQGSELFDQLRSLPELVGEANEVGQDFNTAQDILGGQLDSLNNLADQYERVLPNLSGERADIAQGILDQNAGDIGDIESALEDNSLGERVAGSLGSIIEDSPLLSGALDFANSGVAKGLGGLASGINAVGEGYKLEDEGDDLLSAEAGGLADFGVGLTPYGAADALGKLSVLGAGQLTGDTAESQQILGNGVFTDTAVDGARALVNLGEAAVTGDTSGLDNFRDTVDNGSLFERVLGTAGNLIGATGAAIATGSTQPFSDFADDTERAFGTLGQVPAKAPQPAPVEDDLSNPFSNYETPQPDPTEIPSYELNSPDLGFGESYGQDFVPDYGGEADFGGGGGGGGGIAGAKEFTFSEE